MKCFLWKRPILFDAQVFKCAHTLHFIPFLMILGMSANSTLFPKLYIRPLSQPNYLRYLESHLVRNVEITPKPVWALYWVTAPCFIEKTLILAVLLFCSHNENYFIHSFIFHHIFFQISRFISWISLNQIYKTFFSNIQFCILSQETHPLEGLWPLQSASIDHGRRFRCANGALWSIRFQRTGVAGVSGCWSTLSARGLTRGVVFAAQ